MTYTNRVNYFCLYSVTLRRQENKPHYPALQSNLSKMQSNENFQLVKHYMESRCELSGGFQCHLEALNVTKKKFVNKIYLNPTLS